MVMDDALRYAVRLLSQRPYSKSRLLFKLKQKGYEAEAAQVLVELEEKGAINDTRFACAFVEQTQLQRPSGKQRVILALRRRGIDQETAVAAWQKWEVEAVGVEAVALAAAKARLARGDLDLQRWEDKQKLLAFLNRRGFVYTEAKAALTELLSHERTTGTTSASDGSD